MSGESAGFIGLDPAHASAAPLVAELAAAGMTATTVSADGPYAPALLVWAVNSDLTQARAATLSAYVAGGGRLLLFGRGNLQSTGTGFLHAGEFMPATSLYFTGAAASRAWGSGFGWADPALWPAAPEVVCTQFLPVPPILGVERGEARYDLYDRAISYINLPRTGGTSWYTRDLRSREWTVRARTNRRHGEALCTTGRFGAGRIAVAGVKADGLYGTAQAQRDFWKGPIAWLRQTTPDLTTAAPPPSSTPAITVDRAARQVQVQVANSGGSAAGASVIARILTWEGAFVADRLVNLALPAGGDATAAFTMPTVDATSYQASAFADHWRVRIGVLDRDGALRHEQATTIDCRPDVRLELALDNEWKRTWPWPGSAQSINAETWARRMGMPVMAYAYKPNGAVEATVTLANGVRNIAPLATVGNITRPDDARVWALTDGLISAEKWDTDDAAYVKASGWWDGIDPGADETLQFSYAAPVTVSAVTIVAAAGAYRAYHRKLPGAVRIEIDGVVVADIADADAKILAAKGRLRIPFTPRTASSVRVILPWEANYSPGVARWSCALGEIEIDGSTGPLPGATLAGTVSLVRIDALTNAETVLGSAAMSAAPGAAATAAIGFALPAGDSLRAWRIEARLPSRGLSAAVPALGIDATRPLPEQNSLAGDAVCQLGFLVTGGYRQVRNLEGTGTQDGAGGWSTPDDLVWAYARDLKDISASARTAANRLFSTTGNLRHYANPWRSFLNGEDAWQTFVPGIIAQAKTLPTWPGSTVLQLKFSDGWEWNRSKGSLYGWRDCLDFDRWLKQQGHAGLRGRTRDELQSDITANHQGHFEQWAIEMYHQRLKNLRAAVVAEGRTLQITEQGIPLVAGEAGADIATMILGSSDDNTWGMIEEDPVATAGRHLAAAAINPSLVIGTQIAWHYDSARVNNPHWHAVVGTSESSRRHAYARAWRGVYDANGQYRSMHGSGYKANAQLGFAMALNDWQEGTRTAHRHTLITPHAPEGIILVTPQDCIVAPSPVDGLLMLGGSVRKHVEGALGGLSANGLPVSGAGSIPNWGSATTGRLAVVLAANFLTDAEAGILSRRAASGARLVVFASRGLSIPSTALRTLCGIDANGNPTDGTQIGTHEDRPVVQKGPVLFIRFDADDSGGDLPWSAVSAFVQAHLSPTLRFTGPGSGPVGISGYGFRMHGRLLVALGDWREEGRTVQVRWTSAEAACRAVSLNDHRKLTVTRSGGDWIIDVPMRPGDGELILVEAP